MTSVETITLDLSLYLYETFHYFEDLVSLKTLNDLLIIVPKQRMTNLFENQLLTKAAANPNLETLSLLGYDSNLTDEDLERYKKIISSSFISHLKLSFRLGKFDHNCGFGLKYFFTSLNTQRGLKSLKLYLEMESLRCFSIRYMVQGLSKIPTLTNLNLTLAMYQDHSGFVNALSRYLPALENLENLILSLRYFTKTLMYLDELKASLLKMKRLTSLSLQFIEDFSFIGDALECLQRKIIKFSNELKTEAENKFSVQIDFSGSLY